MSVWIYPKAVGRGSRPPLVAPAATRSHFTRQQCYRLKTPSVPRGDRAASAISTVQVCVWTLVCPASSCTPCGGGLRHCTQLICSLLPLGWEEQATTVLGTHPHRAAAFSPHLELLTREVKHCKYILKTPRLVNAARKDYCL